MCTVETTDHWDVKFCPSAEFQYLATYRPTTTAAEVKRAESTPEALDESNRDQLDMSTAISDRDPRYERERIRRSRPRKPGWLFKRITGTP